MKLSFTLLSLFLALPAFARFDVPGFELVYTAPVETTLAAPDLRNPADVWVEMIGSAKKSLVFGEMYAVSKPGEPLEPVIAALEKAGARGVKIRFMLEKKMLRASDEATIERLRKIKNLELRIYEFGKLGTDGIVHAKYFVVDGREAYVGSQNFDWRSLKHIHETGLRITDAKIVKQVARIFEQDWKLSGLLDAKKPVPAFEKDHNDALTAGARKAYLVAGPPNILPAGVIPSEKEIVRLIGGAKKEIRAQVLDYSTTHRDKTPYLTIDKALRAAAARGVEVKLLVSHWSTEKPAIDALKALATVPHVEVRVATIPRAKEGKIPFARVNHSKIMAIDGKIAWVGTSNWSGGYLDKLRNLEVVVKNEKLAKRLAALHEQLWSSAYSAKVDPAKEYPKPDKGTD
jgi:phosphatidylserine/phosphatidylglycerophosphate/cardiolipin synthase-like enzyme